MQPDHITVREIADIMLGNPDAEGAMISHLQGDGIKIVEDWAGRQAVVFKDAKRVVGDYVRKNRRAEEEYHRERALLASIANAQNERDALLYAEWSRLSRTTMDKKKVIQAAVDAVRAAEKDLPREITSKLTWLPLATYIPGTN